VNNGSDLREDGVDGVGIGDRFADVDRLDDVVGQFDPACVSCVSTGTL
jgi:hypothetical protein